jgi:thioredoxin-dependent peroxiredoxin
MATARKKTSSKTGAASAPPRVRPPPATDRALGIGKLTVGGSPAKKAPETKAPKKKTSTKATSATKAEVQQTRAGEVPAPAVGARAPAFSLLDQDGKKVTSASLKGKPYVIYFYPKDNTPGCTLEACDFRDNFAAFRKLGVEVFGVSPDSAKSHQGFTEKHQLPFTLLVDDEKELAKAYGVWTMKKNYGREFLGIVRSTFVVDGAGKIGATWRGVRVAGHALAVLGEAKKASRS